jgi:hypothetical protein
MMIRTPNWNLWTRKRIALMAAILVLASGAAYASISLARSTPVESAVLSDRWQCTRTAGVLTVCTKKPG